MLKKFAWNAFKNTGNINTYLEFVETENIEKEIEKNEIQNIEINNKTDIEKM